MNVNNIQKQKIWIGLILANNLMSKTRIHFIEFNNCVYKMNLHYTYYSGHFSQMTQVKNDG